MRSRESRRLIVAFAVALLPTAVRAEPILASPRADGMPVPATGGPMTSIREFPISANGRYVAFDSSAADLVASPLDGNGAPDVFVRDLLSGTTTLVSVRADGTAPGSHLSTVSAMSSDGRYVLFESHATDLVSGDNNNSTDVFVRDLQAGVTTLVSVAIDGISPGNGNSLAAAMSPDGRFVLFASDATTLAATDTNGRRDVFVRDLQTSVTTLVSVNSSGTDSSNQLSEAVAISDDGRYVSFSSLGTNLVSGVTDSNGGADVFRRDLQAGVTQLVSANVAGTATGNIPSQPVAITGDGRYVLFRSAASNLTALADANGNLDVFVRDCQLQTTTLASVNAAGSAAGAGQSTAVAISSDGRYVAFHSSADDLVAGDGGNTDAFVRDLQLGTTALVSRTSGGTQANWSSLVIAMTADARYVVLDSIATNLAAADLNASQDVFVRDRQLGTTTLASVAAAGGQSANSASIGTAITPDGRYVVLASFADDMVVADFNGGYDLFVRDLQASSTSVVSARAALPVSATPSSGAALGTLDAVSADGRFVAFTTRSADVVPVATHRKQQVYVRDLQRAVTTMASLNAAGTAGGNYESYPTGISADGRYLLLSSVATDLVSGVVDGDFAWDVFVRDLQAGVTTLASVRAAGGAPGNLSSEARAITPSGGHVLFSSDATDLVASDANGFSDVFVRDLQAASTVVVSTNAAGSGTANGRSTAVAFTPNARFVVFDSEATNLVALTVGAGLTQVYVRDRQSGTTELVSVNAAGSGGGNASSRGTAISADGRYVLFGSLASNLGSGLTPGRNNVFLRDRQAGTTVLVSRNLAATGNGNDHSFARAMSANGRYVAFDSGANDLVTGDDNGFFSDVFVRDLQSGTTTLVSVDASGTTAASGQSSSFSISADGRLVSFDSFAPDVVAGDANGKGDAFVRDLVTGTTTLISANAAGVAGDGWSELPLVNAAGTRIVFHSTASNLAVNDLNGTYDAFAAPFPAPDLPFADGFESGTLIRWTGFRP